MINNSNLTILKLFSLKAPVYKALVSNALITEKAIESL